MQFKLLLCRSLHKTLGQLEDEMSQAEFEIWLEEYSRRPWGEDIEDLRAGIIASTVANVHSSNRTFAPSDFMPKFGQPVEQTEEECESECKAFFGVLNARK